MTSEPGLRRPNDPQPHTTVGAATGAQERGTLPVTDYGATHGGKDERSEDA
jgi:hypothetical protein